MQRMNAARRRWFGYGGLGALVAVALVVVTAAIPTVAADTLPVATGASAPQQVKFSGNGFSANEMLSFWMTASDRTVTPLESAQADNFGGFAVTITLPTDGMWQVTAHGLTSKHEIVSRYAVGQAATITNVTATTPTDATTPTTGGIYPHAVVGQATTIAGNGFGASENVSAWQTSPEGAVKALDGIQAESNGQFIIKVTFDSVGFWQVTFHGATSGHESVRGFTVDATAVSTAPPAAAVLSTALTSGNTPIVLPTFTPVAGTTANTNASASAGGTNAPVGAGQQLLTPSAAQLTPPALAVQPQTGTPTAAP